jgi:glycosyltransferase involved in cell wall biosynthesis
MKFSMIERRDNPHNSPLVSIVIPCYRQGHFLGEAIESVLNQTYPNHEIVVIDDGSPDDASQVASRYAGVRLIRQENQGLSAARNRGISESQGEFLVFLDADDRLLPGGLESGLICMAQRPESELVFGRYRGIKLDGALSGVISDLCVGDLYLGLLARNCIGPVAPVMFRREVFDKVGGFDTSISPASDYDIYLRIARRYPTHRHDGIVAEYRVYNSSMSADMGSMLRAVIISLRSQQRYVKGNVERARAYRAGLRFWQELYGEPLYNQTSRRMSRRILEIGDWRRTIRDLWYLIRYYPQSITLHGSSRISKLIAHLKRA